MLMQRVVGLVFGLATLASTVAQAGVVDGAGNYSGVGAVFSRDGVERAQYQIEMVSTAIDAQTLSSQIKITLSNGEVREFTQKLKDTERGYSIESDQGNGGGYCFGEGLCQGYMGTQAHGFVVTTALDGTAGFRVLITELENGQAVRFIREKLIKKD